MKNGRQYGPFKRILFCTDFSENADLAFGFAVEQARRLKDSVLYLLHVVPEPEAQFWRTYLNEVDDVESKGRQDMDRKISESYRAYLPEGLDMRVEIRSGADYDQILAFADEIKADLIIMGRQGRSSLGKVLFGNVTEKVVRKARCPVLVIPLCFENREVPQS